ncbi:MAG TPA: NAD(+)/NADH kinase [Candidatus Aenigmarchaeota archaeon]|nr:MAG: hypothetical protein DRP03_01160 [Candidatus Aenigmarchaeota archaeon]HDD46388.1 NAD(+)/NADH kinase [Candidatus Aenigmarchaeota archaeon]
MKPTKVKILAKKKCDEIKYNVMSLLTERGIEITNSMKSADFFIIIGGDGTLFRYHSAIDAPIFGIKPGTSIGHYMSACEKDYMEKLNRILSGKEGRDYFLNNILRLECEVNGKKLPFIAINEFLISAIYTRRMLNAELQIDNELTIERCSGIIAYTPTGSTAFAGSAGAKPLRNGDRFGVIALAPYAGKLKSGEVIIEEGEVGIIILSNEAEVCVDGQEEQVKKLRYGDAITVRKSRRYAKIITF